MAQEIIVVDVSNTTVFIDGVNQELDVYNLMYLYEISPTIKDAKSVDVVLTPSLLLPPEDAQFGLTTQAEKDEFDLGTLAYDFSSVQRPFGMNNVDLLQRVIDEYARNKATFIKEKTNQYQLTGLRVDA